MNSDDALAIGARARRIRRRRGLSLDVAAGLAGISLALNDFGPDEVPDLTPRPLEKLVAWAERANEHRDQGRTRAGTHWPGGIWARCSPSSTPTR